MSSAAVQQSTPQQYQQQSSRYSASPTSPRRPAGRSGSGTNGGGNVSAHNISPQAPYSASPREAMSPSTYQHFYPDAVSSVSPAATSAAVASSLPVRTNQPQSPPSAYDTRQYNSPQNQSGYGSDSERTRRKSGQPTPSPAQSSASRGQRNRSAPQPSRSQNAVGQTPVDTSLPRENSAIINHIVVDDPQSDLARERARIAEARPSAPGAEVTTMPGVGILTDQPVPESHRRSRQEHLKTSSHRKEVKFGDYILGQTLGEGEFGKVKMGWKKEGGVQVAIKLIRKESLAGNTTRLPKIYREISILRELEHPNIVRLHEFVETERHMGIILEYASGGELFDYILNHRYLKDPAARRLFAQLVSGVGYLHKKGIVHRDLKLENLLLDRNRNIIITDFGFANTFNPVDELGEEVELHIGDKDFVKREGLDAIGKDGHRRGDLMQTSCGSPCYAAPELVVSDGLYTGRKVDVWSCGVILYAMLAGYLPFDDDPANPEGDNINLLYKYIVSTPLTFPEYVTPHARDLLRRILVPDPRRRADLFEVARHSWLSEFSHVVGFIGSSTKSDRDIATSAWRRDEEPTLGRSASVREPSSRSPPETSTPTSRPQTHTAEEDAKPKQGDAKRRTVQVEYVAPAATTTRGDSAAPAARTAAPSATAVAGRTRARAESSGPVEVTKSASSRQQIPRKEIPTHEMHPPVRAAKDQTRSGAENAPVATAPIASASRPNTGGGLGARLPSRGNSYSRPSVATPTTENAQGRFSQPKSSSGYIISGPLPQNTAVDSRPATQHMDPQQLSVDGQQPAVRAHRRSTTLSSLTDRVLGRSSSKRANETQAAEKRDRRHPPVSMRNAMPSENASVKHRKSTETSSRRPSFSFSKKNPENQSTDSKRNSRRFSWLPSNFSMSSFAARGNQPFDASGSRRGSFASRTGRPESKSMAFGRGASPSQSEHTSNSTIPLYYDPERDDQRTQQRSSRAYPPEGRPEKPLPQAPTQHQGFPTAIPTALPTKQYRDDGYGSMLPDRARQGPSEPYYTPGTGPDTLGHPQRDMMQDAYQMHGDYDQRVDFGDPMEQNSSSIRPNQRRFGDAYDQGHGGSSSGARRVMDFFRRRGKDRSIQQ